MLNRRIIIFANILIFSISTFSQTSSLINTQVDSIFKSRGYRLWQREKDGIIEFEKKITKKITREDILNSQKYYGCKCDKDTRLTLEEDLDREYKVVKIGIVSSETLNEIIPAEYDYVDNIFSDNKLLAKKDSNYFLFDRNGKELDKELIKDFVHIDVRCSQNYHEYDCGFRRVQNKNGKWGYINQNWKIVIPCIYDNLEQMKYYGYSAGTLNGNIGIINNRGDFKQVNGQSIEPFPYYESLYTVYTSNYKKGVVDINANIVINPIYDYIDQKRNYFFVKLNGKWGVVDKFNSVLIPINFFGVVQSSGETLKGISVKLHKDSSFISYEVLQERERFAKEEQEEARRVEEEKKQRKIQMAEEQARQKELKKMYAELQSTTINYISRFLKNPDGASWISYNGPEETRRQLNESRNYLPNCDNVFATMITVDATNSFGGYIRSTYIVFFKDNYPCHFEDIKAIDKARNSASRVGDMNNMLSLTLQLNGCGCR